MSFAQDLPTVQPETVGFCSERLNGIDAAV
jgi:hypothetical protein